LQQTWLAELGRVGLPVNLPFYDSFDLEVLALTPTGDWAPVGGKCKRAAIVSRHPRDSKELSHFTLTPIGRNFVYDQLKAAAEALAGCPLRLAAAQALLNQAKTWNAGLTETPHRFGSDYHEDIGGLLFAWRVAPKLKGLLNLTDPQKAKLNLNEVEQKAFAKHEKVALIVVINPSSQSHRRGLPEHGL
jgi:hypothetical protein